jgi:hypothetical protein
MCEMCVEALSEFGVDSPSKSSIYSFYRQFCEAGCVKGKFPLLQNVLMELEYQFN